MRLGLANCLATAADAVGNVGGSALNAASDVGGAATKAGGSLLKYLVPVGLLAVAAMWGIPKLIEMNSTASSGGQLDNVTAKPIPGVSGIDFSSIPGFDALGETGTKLTSGLNDLTSGLEGVADEAGAKSYAEKITGFTGSIDGMGLDKLDGVAKTATSTILGKFIETIKGLLASKSDGIQGILKPVIDTLMEKLSPFGG